MSGLTAVAATTDARERAARLDVRSRIHEARGDLAPALADAREAMRLQPNESYHERARELEGRLGGR